jgi:hypothetical protein
VDGIPVVGPEDEGFDDDVGRPVGRRVVGSGVGIRVVGRSSVVGSGVDGIRVVGVDDEGCFDVVAASLSV